MCTTSSVYTLSLHNVIYQLHLNKPGENAKETAVLFLIVLSLYINYKRLYVNILLSNPLPQYIHFILLYSSMYFNKVL